jgi:hypothetical protein
MNTKILSVTTILGTFALMGFLLLQLSMDIQTSFAEKGGEPRCGHNQKAIDASNGKCLNCDEVVSGACPDPPLTQ